MNILELGKGGILDLTKNRDLKQVKIACGWDVSQNNQTVDLDLSAFLMDRAGKVLKPAGSNVLYYRQPQLKGIWSSGDNRDGSGEGDDEIITVTFKELDPNVERILFVITIHEATEKKQTFKMVRNAYARAIDAETEEVLVNYNLKDDYAFDTAVSICEVYKEGNEWLFKAVGKSEGLVDLNGLLNKYL